ncbi:MAG: hypothetical protein ACK2UE_09110 [Anaerolineales bacterium]
MMKSRSACRLRPAWRARVSYCEYPGCLVRVVIEVEIENTA